MNIVFFSSLVTTFKTFSLIHSNEIDFVSKLEHSIYMEGTFHKSKTEIYTGEEY